MSEFKILMPKLGESIQEGTITKWFVKVGDRVEEDDLLFEVATDKVDSEIPSPVDGLIVQILFPEGSLIPVGEVLAIINTGSSAETEVKDEFIPDNNNQLQLSDNEVTDQDNREIKSVRQLSNRFYSPLVKTIANQENVSLAELETIKGSGAGGRIQKNDLLRYLDKKDSTISVSVKPVADVKSKEKESLPVNVENGDEVIEMDRVRKLISDHMVMSVRTAPHVTSVVEADVTELVMWRNKNKDSFQAKYGEKITYMPVFAEAVAAAISEFPLLNSSVSENKIIIKKNINLGIAVAKPDGNLIVPVIHHANQKNLIGLTKELNRLAQAARTNKLTIDEIQGGTFTITNFGSFRNLIGTPIINQPQVAILATGSIEKKPAVLETPTGDVIAVRHKMYLSLSYDHRIIDGALGGAFLRRIADILENFKTDRSI